MTVAEFDMTDVAPVAAAELALVLRFVAGGRRTLLSGREICETELARIETAFWSRVDADAARKAAVLVRFRSLMGALGTRRITTLLRGEGQSAVPFLLEAAATMRLNVNWGLNPNRLIWRMTDAVRLAAKERARETGRLHAVAA